MINYIEKGPGLHALIARSGYTLEQRNGVWVSNNDTAVQGIIDAYSLSTAQNEIITLINDYAASLRDHAASGVSPAEMASWSIKRTEAMAYQVSGNAADAPILGIEAAARGMTLSALVARVLKNATSLAGLEATIAGVAGKHSDAVRATTTFAEALSYDWSDWTV